MTPSNDIGERIRDVELELAEIKIRLNKKHDELENLHSEMNKLADCINKVTILTEKVNTTQKDMWSELKEVQKKQDRDVNDLRERLDDANKTIIKHSARFESYKDRQKSAYTLLTIAISAIAIIAPIIVEFIMR